MENKDRQQRLIGKWKKITTTMCSEIYPDGLEFREHGIYGGQKGEEAGEFTLWGAGEYQAVAKNRVKISTANDAEIVYEFSIFGDVLIFVDRDGCEFQYRRVE